MMTYFFQFPPAEQQLHSFPSSAEQSWPVGLAALVRLDGGGGQRSRFEAACARLRKYLASHGFPSSLPVNTIISSAKDRRFGASVN